MRKKAMRIAHMPAVAGVYVIRCEATGKVYVGSSCNMARRAGEHLSMLRHGTHTSPYLQRAWDRHGEGAFAISVVQAMPKARRTTLLRREQYHMDHLHAQNPAHGYNYRQAYPPLPYVPPVHAPIRKPRTTKAPAHKSFWHHLKDFLIGA